MLSNLRHKGRKLLFFKQKIGSLQEELQLYRPVVSGWDSSSLCRWRMVWLHRKRCGHGRRALQADPAASAWQHADLLLSWGALPVPRSDENLPEERCLEASPQEISPSGMQTWVVKTALLICLETSSFFPTDYFALQRLSALTPTFWSLAASHLLRKATLWLTRPPTSASLDSGCEVHPDVSA